MFAKSPAKLFRTGSARPKLALLATEVRRHSHAQHFIDRFLEGYGWQGRHYHPAVDLVSLYVDQFPEGDLSRDRAARHPVKIYPTIAEALTLGGAKLAVDGVVIIGEHGKYARNEKGQTLYPRYKWFKEVVRVFEASSRVVPVFNDKHLSTDWRECVEMVADSKRLDFPFLAGSSLPVTWRIPSIDMPLNTRLQESVCVCYGSVDSYDFHGIETAQCMSERRRGGEVGVKSVHAVRGNKVWETLEKRESTQWLLRAALNRSHTCKAPPGYTLSRPSGDWFRASSPDAIAYFIEHRDGFKTTMFLLNGLVQDFTYAGLERSGKNISTQMHLPMPTRISTTADFFNPLVHHIEDMILTGVAPYPIERTLLTSGMTLSAVESLHREQIRLDTPELNVAYRPATNSTFWRA
ncbi:MAG: hypothetical protein HY043_17955 [Verrucomicrobia bacterium]|nr:hypothetical protein [Verrucomicrobiota bacterium]